MAKKIYEENDISAIAAAIRSKNGSSNTYLTSEMAGAINDIPTGYPEPTGTAEITENGTFDIKDYEDVEVNVGSEYETTLIDYLEADLTTINIPKEVTRLKELAFYGCRDLKNITIPSNVQYIGRACFDQCHKLESVVFQNLPTSIPGNFCNACTSLASIDIPSSVTNIYAAAFHTCTSLRSITVRSVTPPTLDSSSLTNVPNDANIYVPLESVDIYKSATNWSARAAYIQAIPEE